MMAATLPGRGYSAVPLAVKLGGLPAELGEGHDVVHAVSRRRADLDGDVETFKKMVAHDGAAWISWPQRASKIATNITEDVFGDVVLPKGPVGVKVCAVDAVWGGIKPVIRKELCAKL